MKQVAYLLMLAGIISFSSCTEKFKKGPDNWEYKIIEDGKGAKIMDGDFIHYEIAEKLHTSKKDSALSDSRENMARIEKFDSASTPKIQYAIFKQLRVGDSAIMRIKVDSLFTNRPMPPFIKKGDMLYVTYKMVAIYKDVKDAEVAYKKAAKEAVVRFNSSQKIKTEKLLKDEEAQIKADDKAIQDYFAKNNITGATKTKYGTYIVIKEPGTGATISDTNIVNVKYTGKLLDGTRFDSNMDTAAMSKEPLTIQMNQFGGAIVRNGANQGGVIIGWYDGLMQLKSGSKAQFYIPSTLGYGKQSKGDIIKENSILMFDIEIPSVLSIPEEERKAEVEQRKMEEMQQRQMDSINKAQAKMPKGPDSAVKK